jgi:squalene cyclase
METAIYRGLDFILKRQDKAGFWSDWDLPPGPSPDWTTAYIGLRLSGLGPLLSTGLSCRLDRAALWLLGRQFPDGGWGYNNDVGSDADSTAQAILFLATTGHTVPCEAYTHLARFQCPDGGFSTFLPDALTGSWGLSHPEITPVVLLAFRTHPKGVPENILAPGLAWIRRARSADGIWHSFWWSTPLPATEANLTLLATLGTPEPLPPALAQWEPDDSLEAAHLISIAAVVEPTPCTESVIRLLISDQASDGSWQSAPSLRVTSRSSVRPWKEPMQGPLFTDPRRLFSTATAISALGKVYRNMTGELPQVQ